MKLLLKQMYPFLKPHLRLAVLAALCALPLVAIKAYQAYLIKDVVDEIFAPDATEKRAYQLAAIIFCLALMNYPLRYFHNNGIKNIVDRVTCAIRREIYKKLNRLPASFYSESRQGELLSNMTNDTTIFAEAFMHVLASIREPLTAICLLGVAFYHDWKLTLIVIAIVPIFVFIFKVTGKTIRKYISKAQEDTADMTHFATEGIVGQKIIKAFGLDEFMLSRFEKAQDKFLAHKKKSNSAEAHSHPAVEVVGAFMFATFIVFAFYRSQEGGMTAGEFISLVGALAMFMDPVRRFSKSNAKINYALAAGSRVFKLLGQNEEVDEGKKELKDFKESIEFKNVSFSYGDHTVIKDFNLKISKGEKVALVGLSGSGKSTLISLLLRLYHIEKGQILIDGIDLKDYKMQDIRALFALVSQDIFLFNDTVKENLTAGESATSEQIQRALDVSYSNEFVNKLPEKLETQIGDRGLKLSGGQSQRLTIARAFLRDCPVMLFDEATSALDNESEKVVQKALDEVGESKTVVAVAHRLSTIQDYDRIVVMKEGRIIQVGNHLELIEKQGEYKKLYELSVKTA